MAAHAAHSGLTFPPVVSPCVRLRFTVSSAAKHPQLPEVRLRSRGSRRASLPQSHRTTTLRLARTDPFRPCGRYIRPMTVHRPKRVPISKGDCMKAIMTKSRYFSSVFCLLALCLVMPVTARADFDVADNFRAANAPVFYLASG